MTRRTQDYRQHSHDLLTEAQEELANGSLPQASEKGWGAAAVMVKAWAEQNETAHTGHNLIWNAVDDLVEETQDPEISRLFGVAESLHTNFYENHRSARMVGYGIRDVERFVEKVEALL